MRNSPSSAHCLFINQTNVNVGDSPRQLLSPTPLHELHCCLCHTGSGATGSASTDARLPETYSLALSASLAHINIPGTPPPLPSATVLVARTSGQTCKPSQGQLSPLPLSPCSTSSGKEGSENSKNGSSTCISTRCQTALGMCSLLWHFITFHTC